MRRYGERTASLALLLHWTRTFKGGVTSVRSLRDLLSDSTGSTGSLHTVVHSRDHLIPVSSPGSNLGPIMLGGESESAHGDDYIS